MTASSDYTVRCWSGAGKKDPAARLLGSQDEIWSLAYHPQDPLLVTGNKVGDVTFWSALAAPAPAQDDARFLMRSPPVQS